MLVPANVGFQEENVAPEGLERVMGVNSAEGERAPLRVREFSFRPETGLFNGRSDKPP
jgi:hypothetical protein